MEEEKVCCSAFAVDASSRRIPFPFAASSLNARARTSRDFDDDNAVSMDVVAVDREVGLFNRASRRRLKKDWNNSVVSTQLNKVILKTHTNFDIVTNRRKEMGFLTRWISSGITDGATRDAALETHLKTMTDKCEKTYVFFIVCLLDV